MATQAISESGAVYTSGGYEAVRSLRDLGLAGSLFTLGTLARSEPSRPLAGALPFYAPSGVVRQEPSRILSLSVASYASGGLLSLENLRLLSPALSTYLAAGLSRASAARPLNLGYLLTLPVPPPPPVDATPPLVGNYDPSPGTPISKTTSISFDVTEESGAFGRIFVIAFYADSGVSELIHDGDGFRGFYVATSSRRAIAGGYRYTVLRTGGWPSAPTIQTFAVDQAGNEAN